GAAPAVVVDVDDRDTGHAYAVEHLLAACRVAVGIAGEGLLHELVADAGVLQRGLRGPLSDDVIGLSLAGRREQHHADPGDSRLADHDLDLHCMSLLIDLTIDHFWRQSV